MRVASLKTTQLPRAPLQRIVRASRRTRWIWHTLLAAWMALGVLVPFAFIVFSSLKSRSELADNPLGIPRVWQWQNIGEAWHVGHFDRYFLNSIYVALPTVVAVLVLSTLAAYAFACLRFRGREAVFALFLVGLAVPLDILVIPLFYDLLDLHLLNTYWALILPMAAKTLPFGVLLMRSFMEQLPKEILDAGKIDGCSDLRLLWHIVVPLTRPALTSLFVFTFMWTWNLFVLPIVVIQEDAMRTLPVGLNYFQGRHSQNIPLLMAGATIAAVPVVVIYIIMQRQFIKGIVAGAVKS